MCAYANHRRHRSNHNCRAMTKIVIRPRGGFDAARLHTVVVRDGVLLGADLTHEAARDDTLRINARENTLTMSTPVKDNAIKYCKLEEIRIRYQTYAAAAYMTVPEDTSKGVIHGVPESESQEVIEKSLVTDRNPTILHARRMGCTNSIVIVFEGTHVPTTCTTTAHNTAAYCTRRSPKCANSASASATGWTCAPIQTTRNAADVAYQTQRKNTNDSIATKETTVGGNPARAAETQCRRPDEQLQRAAEPQKH
ncbi:hypothetical protein HPB49_009734 [Dermacentor silvarum]|uniref:Uncharacterized protein n=1 Tax=Dermacentor silvarum TaxID=543639 RepID=A0ACB8DCH7_DERSI|nr:hypothetical protein HPB49_009734 [Dermacentor silvarum]